MSTTEPQQAPPSGSTPLDTLVTWESFCREQAELHDKCRGHFRVRNLGLAVPALLLSTLSGVASIGSLQRGGGDKEGSCSSTSKHGIDILQMLCGVASLVSAALFAVHRYMNLPELQREHDLYNDEYTKLAYEIQLHRALDPLAADRTYRNMAEFMKESKRRMDTLVDRAPPIVGRVLRRLRRGDGSVAPPLPPPLPPPPAPPRLNFEPAVLSLRILPDIQPPPPGCNTPTQHT